MGAVSEEDAADADLPRTDKAGCQGAARSPWQWVVEIVGSTERLTRIDHSSK